jgi:hypothetical protein
MLKILRLRFLKQVVRTSGSILTLLFIFTMAGRISAQDPAPYEMLVVGDSHITGQGLHEQNKFYYLVKQWLQSEVFASSRKVNLKVKAHAGSRITVHKEELEKMQKLGDDIHKFHYVEANISTPSIMAQIDIAWNEYKDPASVNLVMLSGCITDVLVADIVSPFYPERKLRERIHRFCGESMSSLLQDVTTTFPNAQVVVVGYFPIASSDSDITTMAHYFLNIIDFPPKLHFLFTNPLSRQILKIFRKLIANRSRLWLKESDREIRAAIAKTNAGLDKPRVLFVQSPIPEKSTYGTKKSLVWEVGENHRPNDETYDERLVECAKVFSEMKYQHYGRLSRKMCELSSVAHPNIEGSKAFADAIEKVLKASGFDLQSNLGKLPKAYAANG